MSRLTIPTVETAPLASKPLLQAVQQQLGSVPNVFRLMAISPAALEGFLGLFGALGKALDARTRERIAIAVAQVNGCDYCMSAHSYLGANLAELDDSELARNRVGRSNDPKADVAVRFAVKVAETRGKVSEADIAELKLAGFSETDIVDIMSTVALNVLTNFLNNAVQTDIDFPVVRTKAA
jgi:uncharacterized peroxidase-related enzyme